eukprot:7740722-Lingulodinium_polyedra.AAC.1
MATTNRQQLNGNNTRAQRVATLGGNSTMPPVAPARIVARYRFLPAACLRAARPTRVRTGARSLNQSRG